ncbi:MAG: PPC domain-containing protein, partial [Bacillota bacterium]|nr:PPC domain-containing protein [Bacillota bacterium]
KTDQVLGISLERKAIDSHWFDMFPEELMNPFYGTLAVVEDVNHNRKIDDDEYDHLQFIDRGAQAGMTYGSFKAEKNKSYILLLTGNVDGAVPLTFWPYEFKVTSFNQRDEDKGSIVKNNIPSKPIALKAAGSKELRATGSLNAGIPYGDEDWYTFTVGKEMKGKIVLDTGMEVDGVISLYKDGKLLSQADYYPEGDSEVLYFDLKKGTYHIKVRDINGNTTLNPYTLSVNYQ